MADGGLPFSTIPGLPPAASVDGNDQVWISQDGVDRRASLLEIAALAQGGSVVISVTSTTPDLSVTGAASTPALTVNAAPKWSTPRALNFTGDVSGSASIDGSANVSIPLQLANVNPNVGAFGDATHVAQFTVNAAGRLTQAGSVPIAYPFNGTVTNVSSTTGDLSVANPTTAPALTVNSAPRWSTPRIVNFTGDVTGTNTVDGSANVTTNLTLAAANANPGTFGDASHVPAVTVNAKGLVTGVTLVPIPPPLGGTVTSVGLTAPSMFTVTGSPVTGAGNLGLALASQAQSTVLAAPNGAAGVPAFRALTAADIQGGVGVTSVGINVGAAAAPLLTIVGSPVTGAGNMTIGFNTVANSLVLAGPATGGPLAPTFRALTAADISGGVGVTSVGLSMPALFGVAGSPVVGSGNLTVTIPNQGQGTVWAGPASGGPGQPVFRALTAADLPAGTGTVTSVGLAMPSMFQVIGSPVTGSGNLTVAYNAQAASTVLAAPAAGGQPTFRALTAADIPSLSGLYLPLATGGVVNGPVQATTVAVGGPLATGDQLSVYSATVGAQMEVLGDSQNAIIYDTAYANTALQATIIARKARGTLAAPLAVASGDGIGSFNAQGWDGAGFQGLGIVRTFCDTYTAPGNLSSYLSFYTRPDGAGATAAERVRIDKVGNVIVGFAGSGAVASPTRIQTDGSFSATPGVGLKIDIFGGTGAYGMGLSGGALNMNSGGAFAWYNATTPSAPVQTMALDGSGNLSVLGTLGVTGAASFAAGAVVAGGALTVSGGGIPGALNIDAPAGSVRQFNFTTAGSARWRLSVSSAAESGGNVGSDFNLQRFSDAGASLGVALSIVRSTGLITLGSLPALTGSTVHGVLVGQGAAAAITSTAAGTAGQVLTSQGAAADPTFTGAVSGTTGFSGPTPAAPTSTTSTMAGMGAAPANCVFTPTRNGRVLLIFTGIVVFPASAPAGAGISMILQWGSGAPPANGAALTGTAVTSPIRAQLGIAQGATLQDQRPFTLCACISGAVVGTTYWADIAQALLSAGNSVSLQAVNFTFMEQ